MNTENLSTMSDADLVTRLETLVREETRLTAVLLLHLAEVEARGLHLAAACPSLYVYCTRILGMSEDGAFKRIRAARVLRKYPTVAAAVADGRLHLTAVVLLAPHLTGDSAEELVAKASGKSKADIEMMLARHAPKPDVSERLERMVEQTSLVLDRGDSGEVVLEPVPPVPPKVEAKRFGKVKNPRAAKTSRLKAYVPNEARRQALARDGLRCSFVAEDGRRCERSPEERLPEVLRALRAMYASRGTGTRCREPVRAFAHANVGSA